MQVRTFTIEEACLFNQTVHELLPVLQSMPLGKNIKELKTEATDVEDVSQGFPELQIRVTGRPADPQLERLKQVAELFPNEIPLDNTNGELYGVRCQVELKSRSALLTFRWESLRVIDHVQVGFLLCQDGVFRQTTDAKHPACGIVYYTDPTRIRVLYPKASPKPLSWRISPATHPLYAAVQISPLIVFEGVDALRPLQPADESWLSRLGERGEGPADYPAWEWVSRIDTPILPQGRWALPTASDAHFLYKQEQLRILNKVLKPVGDPLKKENWLQDESDGLSAYVTHPGPLNTLVSLQSKNDPFQVRAVAELSWKEVEQFSIV